VAIPNKPPPGLDATRPANVPHVECAVQPRSITAAHPVVGGTLGGRSVSECITLPSPLGPRLPDHEVRPAWGPGTVETGQPSDSANVVPIPESLVWKPAAMQADTVHETPVSSLTGAAGGLGVG
jgi:hypothetical protein